MRNIPHISALLQQLFDHEADQLARQCHFIKRQVKFTGSSFAKSLIFGWLKHNDASLEQLCEVAADFGCAVSSQALDQRFTQAAADFMQLILERLLSIAFEAEPVANELLNRFNRVYLLDSTIIKLPAILAEQWPGGANQYTKCSAGIKIEVLFDLVTGGLCGQLKPARGHDLNSEFNTDRLPTGSLRLADLGYFRVKTLAAMTAQGVYWITRWKAGINIYNDAGQRLELESLLGGYAGEQLEMAVAIGEERVAARMLAVRLPVAVAAVRRERALEEAAERGQAPSAQRLALADWEICFTNVASTMLSLSEVRVLYRMRWQIELLFKLWKSGGKVDESRSQNQWRIMCEVFAKLSAMVIEHWLMLHSSWEQSGRSLWKTARLVQEQVHRLVEQWDELEEAVDKVLALIKRKVGRYAQVGKRRGQPAAHQLLCNPGLCYAVTPWDETCTEHHLLDTTSSHSP
jgi:Transposase DDE domain